jgi:hypothetical protein
MNCSCVDHRPCFHYQQFSTYSGPPAVCGGEAIIVPVVSGYYDLIPFTGVLPIVVKATAVTN